VIAIDEIREFADKAQLTNLAVEKDHALRWFLYENNRAKLVDSRPHSLLKRNKINDELSC